MTEKPKLLLVNGLAGIGKTTVARKYIDGHPFALIVSPDDLISFIGQWLAHEDEARKLAFSLAKSMVITHLQAGYDVIVPHLVADASEAAALQDIADANGADYFECVLLTDKDDATSRMLERGSWGEPGSPPITHDDIPIIEELFDKVQSALHDRPQMVRITSVRGDVDGTYRQFLSALG